jgi:hypothetical protein
MATQHVPTLGRPPQAHGRLGAALTGIALVLVLVAGLTIWAVDRGGEQPAPPEPATPVTVAKADPPATAPTRSHTVFLVATGEEAEQVAAFMAALDDERRFGEMTMLVAESDVAAGQLRAFIADLNRPRDAEGLAPIQPVDRRPHAAVVGSAAGGADDGAGDAPLVRFTCR